MKMLLKLITAITMIAGMLLAAPAAANATETDPQSCADVDMTTDSGYCIETYSAEASAKTTDKSIAAVGTKGKILTRYNLAAGIKLKKSEQHNSGCKLVHKATQIPAGATCIRGARGFHYKNSGYTQDNVFTTWMDYVGSPTSSTPDAVWMKFVKRGGQWFKAGDQNGGGNCGNKVWFNGHGPETKLNWRQVINIKSFAHWVFKGSVAVQASSLANAQVKAWCRTAHTSAIGSGSASATSEAAASAHYKLRGLAKIKQWTNAKEAELTQSQTLTVNANARAEAVTMARTDAYADATCEETEQPPAHDECTNIPGDQPEGYQCYPPPAYTQPSGSMPTVNDVLEYNSRTVTYTVTGNPGETLQVVADAKNGGSITAGKTQSITLDSNGNGTGTVTYAAGEVPKEASEYYIDSTKRTIAAGKDVIWIQVRDTHGNTVWAKSNDFNITARPGTPA